MLATGWMVAPLPLPAVLLLGRRSSRFRREGAPTRESSCTSLEFLDPREVLLVVRLFLTAEIEQRRCGDEDGEAIGDTTVLPQVALQL